MIIWLFDTLNTPMWKREMRRGANRKRMVRVLPGHLAERFNVARFVNVLLTATLLPYPESWPD